LGLGRLSGDPVTHSYDVAAGPVGTAGRGFAVAGTRCCGQVEARRELPKPPVERVWTGGPGRCVGRTAHAAAHRLSIGGVSTGGRHRAQSGAGIPGGPSAGGFLARFGIAGRIREERAGAHPHVV